MLNIREVEEYNKVLKYSKGKYKTWDVAEDNALKEAAPLIKFTLGKTIRATEDDNINQILQYSALIRATHTIITCDVVQFLVCYDSYTELNNVYTSKLMVDEMLLDFNKLLYTKINTDLACKLTSIEISKWDRFVSVLPHDTKKDGMYIREHNGSYRLTRDRKTLIKLYDQLGYVSRPGTPPTVVSPDEMTKQDLRQTIDVMDFCRRMGTRSVWSRAMIAPLRKSITNYRSLDIETHKQEIKKFISSTW